MWKTGSSRWKKLDNAAKIFPSLASPEDPEIFRLSCELNEEIDEGLLSSALTRALEDFPQFTDTVRRGVFWYYLEPSGVRPEVKKESEPVLSPLYGDAGGLLFSVTCYGKRINLEMFHALTDGTGAFVFFRNLVEQYLVLSHPDRFDRSAVEIPDVPDREQSADGFTEHFKKGVGSPLNFEFLGDRTKQKKVYRFREAKNPDLSQSVTEGWVSAEKVHRTAKSLGVTVTEYICAELILAIRSTMPPNEKNRAVAVALPVNLRRYFESETMRNFFGIFQITYDFTDGSEDLSEVAASVKKSFGEELTQENMEQKIASQVKMERHPVVRVCPLFLKDFIMRSLQRVSMKRRTVTLSNVGRIAMAEPFASFVGRFDVFNSSSARQLCMCTFGDRMTLTFSSVFSEHEVERAFFRRMAKVDEDIVVASNYLR